MAKRRSKIDFPFENVSVREKIKLGFINKLFHRKPLSLVTDLELIKFAYSGLKVIVRLSKERSSVFTCHFNDFGSIYDTKSSVYFRS